MEVEQTPQAPRFSVCVVGVSHDAVEKRLTASLRAFRYKGVYAFWESSYVYGGSYNASGFYITNKLPKGHYGLEDRVLSNLTYLHSMIVTLAANVTDDIYLGHGAFLARMESMFERSQAVGRAVWLAYGARERILFALAYGFFEGLCRANQSLGMDQSMAALRRQLGSQDALDELNALIARCVEQLTFTDCGLHAEPHTIGVLHEYIAGYEALLFRRRAELGALLAESVDMLSMLAAETLSLPQFMFLFPQVYARVRDTENWRYARTKAAAEGCRGVLLVVGCGHVPHLQELLAQDAFVQRVTVVVPPYALDHLVHVPVPTEYRAVTRYATLLQQEIDAWQESLGL